MTSGKLKNGNIVLSEVNKPRRQNIMRNHTATHLLQAKLRDILGEHVRQAGSLVAPDRLRFDFTHPDPVTYEQLREIEEQINSAILDDSVVRMSQKKLDQALDEGATALFGEKYGEDVRTISIGGESPYSYELCGGTHVSETSEIGTFIITSEGSAAAGIRRIEAVTGRQAYKLIKDRFLILNNSAEKLQCSVNDMYFSLSKLLEENHDLENQLVQLNKEKASNDYETAIKSVILQEGISILKMQFECISINIIRELADKFRKDFNNGIAIFSNTEANNKVQLIVAVSDGLTKQGFHAGNIARKIANKIGGSGGGRPQLAQAGGKDIGKLKQVFDNINEFIKKN